MQRNKIDSALSTALKLLEGSMTTLLGNVDEKALSDSLWSASAETEYAVFLLSIAHQDRAESASRKHSHSPKQSLEFKAIVGSAFELLKQAKASVEAGNLEKSYEAARTARNLLLRAQELLEKKHKEAKK